MVSESTSVSHNGTQKNTLGHVYSDRPLFILKKWWMVGWYFGGRAENFSFSIFPIIVRIYDKIPNLFRILCLLSPLFR